MPGRFKRLRQRLFTITNLWVFLIGAAIAAGHDPLSLPAVSVLALSLLGLAFTDAKTGQAALGVGWIAGTGYFAAMVFWIVEPFFVEPLRHGWMAPFSLFFLAAGLALFWAAAFGVAYRLAKTQTGRLAALIVCLGIAELLRSYVLTGFPWGLLGYVWVKTPLLQISSVIGPHGLAALTLIMAFLPVAGLHSGRIFGGLVAALMMFGLVFGFGLIRLTDPVKYAENSPALRLVQPNAPQHQKWDPVLSEMFYERLLNISSDPAEAALDAIIWPETAVTFLLDEQLVEQQRIGSLAAPEGQVILGLRRTEGRKAYNTLAAFNAKGETTFIYDKNHLVPFGEYVPFGEVFAKFGIHGLAASEGGGFSAGQQRSLLQIGDSKALPLICYEAVFPQILTNAPERPDWVLQITNDAWFGNLAGPQQHLAQARARAVEQGLPVIRVANTGITALIDAHGRLLRHLPLGVAGRLDVSVPLATAPTFYSRMGDWLIAVVLLLTMIGAILRRRSIND